MLLTIGNQKFKHSFLHSLHPLIKFLIFLPIIFLLFLKITISTQFFLVLILFVAAVFVDLPLFIFKKLFFLYFLLLAIFFLVGWLFQKSPGFWTNSTLNEYKDFFGLNTEDLTGSSDSSSVNHGSFLGGELLKVDGKVKLFNLKSCLKTFAGLANDAEKCKDKEHSHTVNEAYKNLNLNIFSLFSDGSYKYVGFFGKWYTVTELQIFSAFYLANRIFLLTVLSLLLTSTSSLFSISYALEDLFRPLRIFRLPTREMALIVFIALRFVLSLVSESMRIIKAQASRGIDYKNGQIKDKVIALLSLFIPLFFISFLKAEELASSMKVRGYRPGEIRTSFKRYNVIFKELILFAVMTFLITLMYYFFFNNYYISSLGKLEYLNKVI